VRLTKIGLLTIAGGIVALAVSYLPGGGPCGPGTRLGFVVMMLGFMALPVGVILLVFGLIAEWCGLLKKIP
jgi:hypothetical protein